VHLSSCSGQFFCQILDSFFTLRIAVAWLWSCCQNAPHVTPSHRPVGNYHRFSISPSKPRDSIGSFAYGPCNRCGQSAICSRACKVPDLLRSIPRRDVWCGLKENMGAVCHVGGMCHWPVGGWEPVDMARLFAYRHRVPCCPELALWRKHHWFSHFYCHLYEIITEIGQIRMLSNLSRAHQSWRCLYSLDLL
jgi:hypothetical protein